MLRARVTHTPLRAPLAASVPTFGRRLADEVTHQRAVAFTDGGVDLGAELVAGSAGHAACPDLPFAASRCSASASV